MTDIRTPPVHLVFEFETDKTRGSFTKFLPDEHIVGPIAIDLPEGQLKSLSVTLIRPEKPLTVVTDPNERN